MSVAQCENEACRKNFNKRPRGANRFCSQACATAAGKVTVRHRLQGVAIVPSETEPARKGQMTWTEFEERLAAYRAELDAAPPLPHDRHHVSRRNGAA